MPWFWSNSSSDDEEAEQKEIESVFNSDRHGILQREGHRHGTPKTLYAVKSLNDCLCELRECLNPMKSALSEKLSVYHNTEVK